jgi:hypothetical protein
MDSTYLEDDKLDVAKSENSVDQTTVIILSCALGLLTVCLVFVSIYFYLKWKKSGNPEIPAATPSRDASPNNV